MPLGLHVQGSDVDVLCEARNLDAFHRHLVTELGSYAGFRVQRLDTDPPAVVAAFRLGGTPVEVFCRLACVWSQVRTQALTRPRTSAT